MIDNDEGEMRDHIDYSVSLKYLFNCERDGSIWFWTETQPDYYVSITEALKESKDD